MSNVASMFLNQISVVDHAYINDKGEVVGGSFNPDFIVSGEMDPVEQVVVDFSTVKKDLKRFIDDKEEGFDHKLWIIDGHSLAKVQRVVNIDGKEYYAIETPVFRAHVPTNAVKIFSARNYSLVDIGDAFQRYLQAKMSELYPTIRIECQNNAIPHTNSKIVSSHNGILPPVEPIPSFFTYVHGLKDSTSWGCQNNSHGHLSFIQISPVNNETQRLQAYIAEQLDGTIFIKAENITFDDGKWIGIEYTTERGTFKASYDSENVDVIVLETETTIEHLVSYIAHAYSDELASVNAGVLYVSEGLSKGALVRI